MCFVWITLSNSCITHIWTRFFVIDCIYIYIYIPSNEQWKFPACFIRLLYTWWKISFQRKSSLYLSRVINSFFLRAVGSFQDFLSSGNSSKDPSGGGFTKSVRSTWSTLSIARFTMKINIGKPDRTRANIIQVSPSPGTLSPSLSLSVIRSFFYTDR